MPPFRANTYAPGTPVTPDEALDQTSQSASICPGAQNTVNNLTTITVPPKVVPQVQAPPPPPPPPTPAPHPSSPSYSIGY